MAFQEICTYANINDAKKKSLYFGTCLASAFARSFVVSVLPVPAGPSGAPPRFNFKAPINVLHKKEHQPAFETVIFNRTLFLNGWISIFLYRFSWKLFTCSLVTLQPALKKTQHCLVTHPLGWQGTSRFFITCIHPVYSQLHKQIHSAKWHSS